MLILDRHKSYILAEFKQYYKENNIISINIPLHLSHLLQLLDITLFLPLKHIYGDKINLFIQALINYITKSKFFITFKAAYDKVFTKKNIKAGFKGAGISL
jgi:hypothetical protein